MLTLSVHIYVQHSGVRHCVTQVCQWQWRLAFCGFHNPYLFLHHVVLNIVLPFRHPLKFTESWLRSQQLDSNILKTAVVILPFTSLVTYIMKALHAKMLLFET